METTDIADLIERVMTGDPWHASNVADLLSALSAEQAGRRPVAGAHTVWELVLHMTGWTREVTARLSGRAAQEPAAGDWPSVRVATPAAWAAAQADLFDAHHDLVTAIRALDPPQLARPVVDFRNNALGTGLSHYVTAHGVLHHTVYHAGQIALLTRALG
ncbi:MAG TPA: DinB family protein [Vicinamibacterales bacterium]|nr:DinB family protein [Vicinamibacterales bacterium]